MSYKLDAKEYNDLAVVWAESLKTRDGEPRYHMMNKAMQSEFIEIQKDRAGENWNFNIGFSSPWIDSYTIKWKGTIATITYQTSDSGGDHYTLTEQITFTKESNRWLVTNFTNDYGW